MPGRVLVGFEPGRRADVSAEVRAAGARAGHELAAQGLLIVDVPGAVPAWAEALAGRPGVRYAEPDYLYDTLETIPDDPEFGSLWGMEEIRAPAAWDLATGSSTVTVAVIDTGLDMTHPDLSGRIWTKPGEIAGNRVDDDANGWVDDVHGADCKGRDGDPSDADGHGTHVAGTIGAVGDNGSASSA